MVPISPLGRKALTSEIILKRKMKGESEQKRIAFRMNSKDKKRTLQDCLAIFSPKKPRPDLTQEPLEMELMRQDDGFGGNIYFDQPAFKNFSSFFAVTNKWFRNADECYTIAILEFARRYPNHEYSKNVRKSYGYTNKQMLGYINGTKYFEIKNIKGLSHIFRDKKLDYDTFPKPALDNFENQR